VRTIKIAVCVPNSANRGDYNAWFLSVIQLWCMVLSSMKLILQNLGSGMTTCGRAVRDWWRVIGDSCSLVEKRTDVFPYRTACVM
jgi:hypothetical protein